MMLPATLASAANFYTDEAFADPSAPSAPFPAVATGFDARDASPSAMTVPLVPLDLKPGTALASTTEVVGYGDQGADLYPVCDDCPNRGIVAFTSYDSWRGISDGSWQNNGISSGLNFGTRLGRFSDLTGIGFQIGGSVAAYDWAGTDYRITHANEAQPQGFVTYGVFRKPTENSRWSAGLVQDWMLNANYGVFGQNPTLSQWRGQVSYAVNAMNEIGLWGTWRSHGDTRFVDGYGNVRWRPMEQLNAFYHYKWGVGAPDSWLWVGVPERDRLAGDGSLGDYLVGLSTTAPLSDRFSVYALVTYMHQSAAAGATGSLEDAWNFTIGLSFYPARNARTNTVAGQCWMPMMPVANNGYFLVDTNQTF
jgi:hypothetical protein